MKFQATFILLLFATYMSAQPGIKELDALAGKVSGPGGETHALISLGYVLAAIFGLVGAVRIFYKWNTTDHHHHMDSEVIGWFMSAIFFLVATKAIDILF